MTDQELLELAATKTPDELTAAELEALRAALPRLPELRQALAERLDIERLLYAGLAPCPVSAADVIARAQRRPIANRGDRWGLAGLAMVLLTLGVLTIAWFARSSDDESTGRMALTPPVELPTDKAIDDKAGLANLPADRTPVAQGAPSASDQPGVGNSPGVLLAAAQTAADQPAAPASAPPPEKTLATDGAAPSPPPKPAAPEEPAGPWNPLATVLCRPRA